MRIAPRTVISGLAVAAALALAPSAGAVSSYYTTECASCHTPAAVGSTATSCNGCHAHGVHPSSAKTTINLSGTTSAGSYTPGQLVTAGVRDPRDRQTAGVEDELGGGRPPLDREPRGGVQRPLREVGGQVERDVGDRGLVGSGVRVRIGHDGRRYCRPERALGVFGART